VQGGDAFSGRDDLEHQLPGVLCDGPPGPGAAFVLHGGEPAQFFRRPGLSAESKAKAVSGLGAFGHRLGNVLLPARALRSQVSRRESASDRHGAAVCLSRDLVRGHACLLVNVAGSVARHRRG
jgi:hypothetical protein